MHSSEFKLKVRTLETLEEMIVSHPFWAGLSLHYFDLLKKCATLQRFDVGQSGLPRRRDCRPLLPYPKGARNAPRFCSRTWYCHGSNCRRWGCTRLVVAVSAPS